MCTLIARNADWKKLFGSTIALIQAALLFNKYHFIHDVVEKDSFTPHTKSLHPRCTGGDRGQSHQIHFPAKKVLQVLDKIHEITECSVSLGEFDKNIDITRIRLLTPGNRAKDTNLLHTKCTPDQRQLLLQSPYIV